MQECTEDVRETRDARESQLAFDVSDPSGATRDVLTELEPMERERLSRLRRAIERGERGEYYPVNKRQDFARWLVSHGRLSEN